MIENLLQQIETVRDRLVRGIHDPFEGLSFRCLLFYADISFANEGGWRNSEIGRLSEVFKSTALMIEAYRISLRSFEVRHDDEINRGFRMLTMFGFMQCITQIVEATKEISILTKISPPQTLRKSEYWMFRNRLNHVRIDPKRSMNNLDNMLPLNEFAIIPGSIDTISYKSSGQKGYAVRHARMAEIAQKLNYDLKPIMEQIVDALNA